MKLHDALAAAVIAVPLAVVGLGAQAEAPMKEADIAVAANTVTFAPLYVAQKAGYFQDEGIEKVNLISLKGGAATNAAVVSGHPFIAWTGANDAVAAAATGQPVRLIGLVLDRLGNTVAVSNEYLTKAGVTPQSPLADKVKALKGARIASGAPGTGGYNFISTLLSSYGLDPMSDAQLIGLSTQPAAHVTAMREGQIDVSVLSPPTVNILVHEGLAKLYINPLAEDVPQFAHQSNHGIVANVDALKDPAERATIDAIMRAVTRAALLIKEDRPTALGYLQQHFDGLPKEVVAEALETVAPAMPVDEAPTKEMVAASLKSAKEGGVDVKFTDFQEIADPKPATDAYLAVTKN